MRFLIKYMVAVAILAGSLSAHAIPLSPGVHINSGTQTSTAVINTLIQNTYGVMELYKSDVSGGSGVGSDSGSFAGSYDTTFSNTPGDPADALLEYVGGATISCPACYLLVKDGNQVPAWYLFNLESWNGMESINMTNFWPNQGAISHVSIFGNGGGAGVPAPGILGLMAGGLVLITIARRRSKA